MSTVIDPAQVLSNYLKAFNTRSLRKSDIGPAITEMNSKYEISPDWSKSSD